MAHTLLIRDADQLRDATPAEVRDADDPLARGLAQALRLIDVRVLDYLIIAPDTDYSFCEAGRL